jgi:peroxiredoxin
MRPAWLLLVSALAMNAQIAQNSGVKAAEGSSEEKLIAEVRALSDAPLEKRQGAKEIALQIRRLPAGINKLRLADGLAFVAEAGDPGREALQEVANTLAQALREQPGLLDTAYYNLAQLVHYRHVEASLDDPAFAKALARLKADDRERGEVDFSLPDMTGRKWRLKDLRGRAVVVTFWASYCKPCWPEMLELQEIQQRHRQDLVVLAITGESPERALTFLNGLKLNLTTLLDADHKVAQLYRISGVGKTFVYDPKGELVAQALDPRTRKQLLGMLKQAGIE